jgi:hypothetical protein
MIDTAQATFFVTAKIKRCKPMTAVRADHANLTVGVTEGEKVLTQDTQTHWRSISLDSLLRKQSRQPEPPKHFAHRSPWTDFIENVIRIIFQGCLLIIAIYLN